MPFQAICPHCESVLQLGEQLRMRKVKCIDCGKAYVAGDPNPATPANAPIKIGNISTIGFSGDENPLTEYVTGELNDIVLKPPPAETGRVYEERKHSWKDRLLTPLPMTVEELVEKRSAGSPSGTLALLLGSLAIGFLTLSLLVAVLIWILR